MRGRGTGGLAVVLAVGVLVAACGGGPPEAPDDGLAQDVFVAVYADLRRAAMAQGGGALEPAERERILAEHGVEEEALLAFVEAHGDDPAFMREVWNAVEERLADTLPALPEPDAGPPLTGAEAAPPAPGSLPPG